jgi:hypothetical protein
VPPLDAQQMRDLIDGDFGPLFPEVLSRPYQAARKWIEKSTGIASCSANPENALVRDELLRPATISDFLYVRLADTAQEIFVENSFLLRDHPGLTAGATLRQVKPPLIAALLANDIQGSEYALIQSVAAHRNNGKILQRLATA